MNNSNQSLSLMKSDFTEHEGEYYMSLLELAKRLGFSKMRSLWLLYKRNKHELESYSTIIKMMTVDGKEREVVCLNELGCYTISMLAHSAEARKFRKSLANFIRTFRITAIPELERLSAELDKAKQDVLNLKVQYFRQKREIYIRRERGLNFTKAGIAEAMLRDGLPAGKIAKYTGIEGAKIVELAKLDGINRNLEVRAGRFAPFIYLEMEETNLLQLPSCIDEELLP